MPRARRLRAAELRAALGRAWGLDRLLLLGWGASLSFAYGRLGFMPLDQSIVFDGAWRVISGQVPFRDFTTPCGITPILMQAAFFAGFGVNWTWYLMHAALVNGLFCVTVHALLRAFGGSGLLAFFYAALSGFLLYPPVGTPYFEQHAFFFLLLSAVLLAGACETERGRLRSVLAALATLAWVASFGSKQNVALFGVLVLAAVALARTRRWRDLPALIGAGAVTLLLCGLVLTWLAIGLGVDAEKFQTYFFALPYAAGGHRVANLLRVLTADPLRTAALSPLPVLALATGFLAALAVVHVFGGRPFARLRSATTCLVVAASLVLTCLYFSATTFNQPEIGFPFVLAALGLAHLACASWLAPRWGRLAALCAGGVFVAIAARDAWYFHAEVDSKRIVLDLDFDWKKAGRPRTPELRAMVYQAPDRLATQAADLDGVIEFLRARPEGFLLLGDHSILYGLARKPSASPSLWFHKGLTLPPEGSPGFARYQAELAANLERYRVRYLVLEGEKTWMGIELRDFPALREAAEASRARRLRIGSFSLVDLGPPVPAGAIGARAAPRPPPPPR